MGRPSRGRAPRTWSAVGTLAVILALAGTPAPAQFGPTGIVVGPAELPDAAKESAAAEDAALLAHLALTITPGMDVRWRAPAGADPSLLYLTISPGRASLEDRASRAIDAAEAALRSIPKKSWRKHSLKAFTRLALPSLGERGGELLLDALKARVEGDPERAAELLREAVEGEAVPLLRYHLGAALLESGALAEAATALRAIGEEGPDLPPPMKVMAEAVVAAADGEASKAARLAGNAIGTTPSLVEPYWLRALVWREACDLYDRRRILDEVARILIHQPCCAGCTLVQAELSSFSGHIVDAETVLAPAEGCAEHPLDSIRDRALALTLAAAGSYPAALEAAARAQARGVGSLRAGLWPVLLLSREGGRPAGGRDSGTDSRQSEAVALEQEAYAGLSHLWSGRPSAAAERFERGERYARELVPRGWSPRGTVQLLLALRLRSLLAAGRFEEALRLADEIRGAGAEAVNGFVVYTAAFADLHAGEPLKALSETRRLASTDEKLWRFLTEFEVELERGNLRWAQTAMSNAFLGVGAEVNICPGVPVEPYLLLAQGRLLLAQGRPDFAARVFERVVSLGARGIFAPDVVIEAWELLGQAREAQGDGAGALEAYREILERWAEGERTPLLTRAETRARELAATAPEAPVLATPP